jgi:TQXA domain-containing protein
VLVLAFLATCLSAGSRDPGPAAGAGVPPLVRIVDRGRTFPVPAGLTRLGGVGAYRLHPGRRAVPGSGYGRAATPRLPAGTAEVLRRGYPATDRATLAREAGLIGTVGPLTAADAAAATQVALWHLVDGVDLASTARPPVRAVYAALLAAATAPPAPPPRLDVTPLIEAGRYSGRYLVRTSAPAARVRLGVAPPTARLVGPDGSDAHLVGDGAVLWLWLPPGGEATFTVTVPVAVPAVREFVAPGGPVLVAATVEHGSIGKQVMARWQQQNPPYLPITGAPIGAVLITGVVLLAAGIYCARYRNHGAN